MTGEDPGWADAWRSLPRRFMRMKRRTHPEGLTAPPNTLVEIRGTFLSFAASVVLVGVVAVIRGDVNRRTHSTSASMAIVVVIGCLSLLGPHFVMKDLDGSSLETLRASFGTRFFLRVAFAQAASLSAFVVGIALGPWWVYFIGAGFAVIGYVALAPTRTRIERDQERLSLAGCQLWLLDALCPSSPHP